jgi:NAD(P)H-hydrate epimerase
MGLLMKNIQAIDSKSLPYLSTDKLKLMDKLMVEEFNISVIHMMECAGLALATLSRLYAKQNILIFAGKGHNGGDGFVAAKHLYNWGYKVSIALSCTKQEIIGIPKQQFSIIKKLNIDIIEPNSHSLDKAIKNSDLLIDSLLGFGITGAPRSNTKNLIQKMNASKKPIIALDIPSGLDCTTGEIYSPCIKAKATLCLAALKSGFKNKLAKEYLGELFLADIGVPPELYKTLGIKTPTIFADANIVGINI